MDRIQGVQDSRSPGFKGSSVVSLKLLYNDNKGCHSRENGNPAEKTGFPRIKYGAGLIKSGMTFSVKSFLRQYTSEDSKKHLNT
jgi:hypothetical protein